LNLNSQSRAKATKSALLRPATPADIPSLLLLERKCATAAHWTKQQYEELFQPGAHSPPRLVLVANRIREIFSIPDSVIYSKASSYLLGFLVARRVAPEWELENIVVAPEARRTGLGTRLLAALLAQARETNSQSVFLEVRESNAAARSLYEKAGFKFTAHRKSYYTSPQEDAVLYTWLADTRVGD
jgi:ribosomal-protein-alanine acetyltransferase